MKSSSFIGILVVIVDSIREFPSTIGNFLLKWVSLWEILCYCAEFKENGGIWCVLRWNLLSFELVSLYLREFCAILLGRVGVIGHRVVILFYIPGDSPPGPLYIGVAPQAPLVRLILRYGDSLCRCYVVVLGVVATLYRGEDPSSSPGVIPPLTPTLLHNVGVIGGY